MIDLKHALQEAGYQVVHIKTDSVKIPVDKVSDGGDVVQFVTDFGEKYGYTFEYEGTYDKFCLVNDAVYVAGIKPVPWEPPFPNIEWSATGAQFQHPYVFKTLFSKEELEFKDFCEARSVVKGSMYLDKALMEEPDFTKMRHIGKTGLFVPVLADGGGKLYRVNEVDGEMKYYAVAGTKGHLWMEADTAEEAGEKDELQIDMTFFDKLKDEAVRAIEQFGSFEEFITP
jgi:hypothetical protein